jgi:hypothetical protein
MTATIRRRGNGASTPYQLASPLLKARPNCVKWANTSDTGLLSLAPTSARLPCSESAPSPVAFGSVCGSWTRAGSSIGTLTHRCSRLSRENPNLA